MISIDTNILIYAHREDMKFHKRADECLRKLIQSGKEWAIPWPCIHEFLAITTHPKIFNPPTPLIDSIIQINCWLESHTLNLLSELDDYWTQLKSILDRGQIAGPAVHDAHIAAICLHHGIKVLWSADRDYSRIGELTIINPLIT